MGQVIFQLGDFIFRKLFQVPDQDEFAGGAEGQGSGRVQTLRQTLPGRVTLKIEVVSRREDFLFQAVEKSFPLVKVRAEDPVDERGFFTTGAGRGGPNFGFFVFRFRSHG
jgi:hypothetical protein